MIPRRSIFPGLGGVLRNVGTAIESARAKKPAAPEPEQMALDTAPVEAPAVKKMSDDDLAHALKTMRLRRG